MCVCVCVCVWVGVCVWMWVCVCGCVCVCVCVFVLPLIYFLRKDKPHSEEGNMKGATYLASSAPSPTTFLLSSGAARCTPIIWRVATPKLQENIFFYLTPIPKLGVGPPKSLLDTSKRSQDYRRYWVNYDTHPLSVVNLSISFICKAMQDCNYILQTSTSKTNSNDNVKIWIDDTFDGDLLWSGWYPIRL